MSYNNAKSEKSVKIGLNRKKMRLAEMLANPDYDGNKTQICKELGVSRDTFYRWIKEDEVLKYTEELIDKYTDAELGKVWKSLLSRCEKGDTQAIKLYFELKGKYKNTLVGDNSTVGGVIIMPEVIDSG